MKALFSFLVLICLNSSLFGQYDANKEKVFTSLEEAMDENPLRVYYLDLNQKNLKAFPKEVLEFQNLIHLNLAHNQIRSLEGIDLSVLPDLKEIILYDNKFRFFPYKELDQAKEIAIVDLGENDLKEISNEINKLRFIQNIDLSGNRISKVAKDIKLPFLERLNIERNYLNEFPAFVFQSSKLFALNIYGNNIKVIPEALNTLSKIKVLNIGDNPIESIPKKLSLRKLNTLILDWVDLSNQNIDLGFIANASHLETLSMEHCNLSEVPNEVYKLRRLKELSVLNNELISLGLQLSKNKKLTKLWLGGNQIQESDLTMIKTRLKKTEIFND